MYVLNTHTRTLALKKKKKKGKKKKRKTDLLKGRRRFVIWLIHIWVGSVYILKRARECLFKKKRMANGTKNAGEWTLFFFPLHNKQEIRKREISVLRNILGKLMLLTIMINWIVECFCY